ncbi:hypothetical protein DO97_01365 [Neosynechococcus sphagnicola sy1]|uniref:Uncharacterized protein n=1 Tax=Neosynechococcus sphagnicola sy1 TaxID=1497020 RepID=A0A098TLL2_9CYAN|nr:hypothetical protein [Neosynechococcus sphagnicola]KGF73194.1 hypothetical protein DO97_01365 [Neosynechococcus sphagnicola sy1]
MLAISNPPVGAIAFGRSGVGYPVKQVEGERVVLQTPIGLKRVPWSAVIHWQFPAATVPDYHAGQRVEVYFPHIQRWRPGYKFLGYSQEWTDRAWLLCPEGHEATCRLDFLRGEA